MYTKGRSSTTRCTSGGSAEAVSATTAVTAAALVPFSSRDRYVLCSTALTYSWALGAPPMARRSAWEASKASVTPMAFSASLSSSEEDAVKRGMAASTVP